jgi:hypothetical protein
MSSHTFDVPVDDALTVCHYEDIYRQGEWWKSVVKYGFEASSEKTETAIYLWHNDDEWTRKNKYVIKTREAWETDRRIIDDFLQADRPTSETTAFPVSDYYTVGIGKTVFQSDHWWKAIVNVTQKGSYETDEVMIYVWQRQDDEWRRRQKYTIKSYSKWEKEREIIDSVVMDSSPSEDDSEQAVTAATERGTSADDKVETDTSDTVSGEIEDLASELDIHLSGEFQR